MLSMVCGQMEEIEEVSEKWNNIHHAAVNCFFFVELYNYRTKKTEHIYSMMIVNDIVCLFSLYSSDFLNLQANICLLVQMDKVIEY